MKVKALLVALCLTLFMAGTALALEDYFDFNTVTYDEMIEICGMFNINIKPEVAAAIIEYREANGPFKVETDLLKVEGFTQMLFYALDPIATAGTVWFDPASAPSGVSGY